MVLLCTQCHTHAMTFLICLAWKERCLLLKACPHLIWIRSTTISHLNSHVRTGSIHLDHVRTTNVNSRHFGGNKIVYFCSNHHIIFPPILPTIGYLLTNLFLTPLSFLYFSPSLALSFVFLFSPHLLVGWRKIYHHKNCCQIGYMDVVHHCS